MRVPCSRSLLLLPVLAWSASALAGDGPADTARQLAERVYYSTLEAQGASHASGQRPELGPLQTARFLTAAARTLRVGLTPTAFQADGSTRLEYDTAAGHNHDRIEITASGPFELIDPASGATIGVAGPGEVLTFVRSGGAVRVAGPGLAGSLPGPLRARPAHADAVLIVSSMRRINRLEPGFPLTAPAYRGELEVYGSEADPARLRLVNLVAVEPYVAGVVVNEGLSSFHAEALKAQAVAARGYALSNLGRFASRGFDIDDSTQSQVYRGRTSETPVALEATAGTEGLVALSSGRILSALYSSSMGGHTEGNEWVFPAGGYPGDNADPALRPVHDSPDPRPEDLSTEAGVLAFYTTVYPQAYEVDQASGQPLTSQHRWTRTRSAAELLARLKDGTRGWAVPPNASSIQEIESIQRGGSGRLMQVRVTGDWGATTIQGWSDLRALATLSGTTPGGTSTSSAPNSPSSIVVTRDAAGRVGQVTFYGGGFGHNVGMSQFGAQGRALRGQDFSQILAGYYTGVEIGTAPLLLSGTSSPVSLEFVAGRGPVALVLESAGLPGLSFEVGGRRFEASLPWREGAELDLSSYVRPGRNQIRVVPLAGPGAALVYIRCEPDPFQTVPGLR